MMNFSKPVYFLNLAQLAQQRKFADMQLHFIWVLSKCRTEMD